MRSLIRLVPLLALMAGSLSSCGPAAGPGDRSTTTVSSPDGEGDDCVAAEGDDLAQCEAGDEADDDDGEEADVGDEGSVAAGCTPGGCNGIECLDASVSAPATTCGPNLAAHCYQSATCERQPDGSCGWTKTSGIAACLAQGLDMGQAPDRTINTEHGAR